MNSISFTRPVMLGILLLVGLFATAQPARLNGHITGLKNRPVVFRYTQQGAAKSDTVFAKNDRFTYQPKPSDDGLISLVITYPRFTSFWYEPGTLTVTGAVEKPYELTITGTKENDLYNQFRQTVTWPYEERKQGKSGPAADSLAAQERRATLAFVGQHPDAQISAYRLYLEAATDQKRVAEHQRLYEQLTPTVQASPFGKLANQQIQSVLNQPVVGRKVPNFTLPDTTGKLASLDSFKGRYVLLDFWGHWCSPCIKAFSSLKTIQEKYAGKLVLIGVAAELTSEKKKWADAIRKHNANWLQLSELTGDRGSVNGQYNISDFPAYLLLDKDGTLLERAGALPPIEKRLATLLDR